MKYDSCRYCRCYKKSHGLWITWHYCKKYEIVETSEDWLKGETKCTKTYPTLIKIIKWNICDLFKVVSDWYYHRDEVNK